MNEPELHASQARWGGLRRALLRWYDAERRDLPWRRTQDPYAIWLSEVMLQQTRVETVIPYYHRFLDAYPTVHALAEAPLQDVLGRWAGLGYYRRARMLHAAARTIHDEHRGTFPATAAELLAIPGVGRYTAGAVASIAFGERVAAVDGNVTRVVSRLFALTGDPSRGEGKRALQSLADRLVDPEDPRSWNQALMELGATVCTPRSPRCGECPVQASCLAHAAGIAGTLPRSPAKKRPTRVRWAAFVLRRGESVLLARRAEEGLFGGMWEAPLTELEPDPPASLRGLLRRLPRVATVRHVLTHRVFEIAVHSGPAPAGIVNALRRGAPAYESFRFAREQDGKPLATMTRKVLAAGGVFWSAPHARATRP